MKITETAALIIERQNEIKSVANSCTWIKTIGNGNQKHDERMVAITIPLTISIFISIIGGIVFAVGVGLGSAGLDGMIKDLTYAGAGLMIAGGAIFTIGISTATICGVVYFTLSRIVAKKLEVPVDQVDILSGWNKPYTDLTINSIPEVHSKLRVLSKLGFEQRILLAMSEKHSQLEKVYKEYELTYQSKLDKFTKELKTEEIKKAQSTFTKFKTSCVKILKEAFDNVVKEMATEQTCQELTKNSSLNFDTIYKNKVKEIEKPFTEWNV